MRPGPRCRQWRGYYVGDPAAGCTGAAWVKLIGPCRTRSEESLETFLDNVTQIISTEIKFVRLADELTACGTDYFEEWQKEGTEYNPRIQQLNDQRRSILGGVYSIIDERSIGDMTERVRRPQG